MPGLCHPANAETALVIKRGADINQPRVVSLTRRDGMPYIDSPKRDTALPEFAIKAVVPKAKIMHMLNLQNYGAAERNKIGNCWGRPVFTD